MNRVTRANNNSATTPNIAALRTANCRVSTPSHTMKNIQAPIKSSIGNHEVKNETSGRVLRRDGLKRLLGPRRGRS